MHGRTPAGLDDASVVPEYDPVRRLDLTPHRFALTEANARALAELCHRLDGLPLAIELAAARTKLLSPEALLHRLERRLPALGTGPADAPARQRTLRETIAWSYELLALPGQRILARLGVFVGGFSLPAGEAVVLDPADPGAVDLLEVVGQLVDHSLLRADEDIDGEPRFAMLETIREFAQDQLSAAHGEALRDRHLAYFLGFAEAEQAQERGVDQAAWVRRVPADRDNFRAALAHAQAGRDAERLLRLAAALERRFWLASGDLDLAESRRWLDAGLTMGVDASPGLRAKALLKAAWTESSDAAMVAVLEESLSEYTRAGHEAGMTEALCGLGAVATYTGNLEAADDWLRRGLAMARRIGAVPQVMVELLLPLGLLAYRRQEHGIASAYYEDALRIARQSGDAWGTAFALGHIGRLAHAEGDLERAHTALAENIELARKIGDLEELAIALLSLGEARIASGSLDAARSVIREGALTSRRLKHPYQAETRHSMAELLNATRVFLPAVRCLAAAEKARVELQWYLDPRREAARSGLPADIRRVVPRAEFEASWAAGLSLGLADALEYGLGAIDAVDLAALADGPSRGRGRHNLSRREIEVLALLAGGRSDGEIAEELFISKKTASVHVAHIKDKLAVESRIEMAMAGIRLGLVDPPATRG